VSGIAAQQGHGPGGAPRASAYVCEAVSCLSARSHDITVGLGEAVAEAGLTDVAIQRVGCIGLCAAGPLVRIPETGRLFRQVRTDGVGRRAPGGQQE